LKKLSDFHTQILCRLYAKPIKQQGTHSSPEIKAAVFRGNEFQSYVFDKLEWICKYNLPFETLQQSQTALNKCLEE